MLNISFEARVYTIPSFKCLDEDQYWVSTPDDNGKRKKASSAELKEAYSTNPLPIGSIDPSNGSYFDMNKFYPGVNLPGFDYGEVPGTNQTDGYSCVSNGIIDWIYNQGLGATILRFPIAPQYMFKAKPTGSYNNLNFTTVFTGYYGGGECKYENAVQAWNIGDYLTLLKHATSKGIFSILDLHANQSHLCAFGPLGTMMSAKMFMDMWTEIAEYVILNVPDHQYVMFELFNEPVNTPNCGDLDEYDWNHNYTVPTIKAIRELESKHKCDKHIIIATTYGNWSGIHAWKNDGSLEKLGSVLSENNYGHSSISKVLIAGHQYCDWNYAGMNSGCHANNFTELDQTGWIKDTTSILDKFGLKWIMTEGNITCGPNLECENIDLWHHWLTQLSKKDTGCVGFTLWYVLSHTQTMNNMGSSLHQTHNSWDTYKNVYQHANDAYDFSQYSS